MWRLRIRRLFVFLGLAITCTLLLLSTFNLPKTDWKHSPRVGVTLPQSLEDVFLLSEKLLQGKASFEYGHNHKTDNPQSSSWGRGHTSNTCLQLCPITPEQLDLG